MPCYHPLKGYRAKEPGPSGKRSLVFDRRLGHPALPPVQVPCGQCIGCRLERSRQWALRCVHEASLHEDNCFLTLTYDNDHLPPDGSVNVRHFQTFMKRLRKRFGSGVRYFHCGEYGDLNNRPHYHALLFNFDFEDKKLWKVQNENRLFTSSALSELWPVGFSSVGSATFQSAAYVARYVLKKRYGQNSKEHYQWTDPETGEVHQRRPEYVTMSRRPGIGTGWYNKYKSEVYPSDFIIMNGVKMKPPKFYDGKLEAEDPAEKRRLKFAREREAKPFAANNTPDRLKVREKVQAARLELLPRNLKEGP